MTRNEKALIRSYWPYYHRIRIMADDTVMAQARPFGAWGVLLRPQEARRCVAALKAARKEGGM